MDLLHSQGLNCPTTVEVVVVSVWLSLLTISIGIQLRIKLVYPWIFDIIKDAPLFHDFMYLCQCCIESVFINLQHKLKEYFTSILSS